MGSSEHRVPMAQDGQILETPKKAPASRGGTDRHQAPGQSGAQTADLESGAQTADLLPRTTHCVSLGFACVRKDCHQHQHRGFYDYLEACFPWGWKIRELTSPHELQSILQHSRTVISLASCWD